jgi:hypothetical protein
MTLITVIPGLLALLVCMRRGPERALIDVYLPTLLLLPDSYHWMITGHLSFNETAIIPIAGFLIAQSWRNWEWSVTDVLVLAYVLISVTAEYVNKDFYEARNAALRTICNSVFPYVVAKAMLPRKDLYADIAKRLVICLTIVSIVNVYEFRMGSNPFDIVLSPLFPGQFTAIWIARYGFLRPAGPFGHAITDAMILAIGYRMLKWLKWEGYWSGNLPLVPIDKIRFCQIWLIVGSVMTMSRGPWLGAGVGALVVFLGRARHRTQTLVVTGFIILLVGIPTVQVAKSYVWVERNEAASVMEESAAYRHELIQRYISIVEERPVWGWGRNNFPTVNGMQSIDNHYLLLALTYGEYALFLFVAILLCTMIRLILFCRAHHGSVYPGSIGLTLLGCIVTITVSITTVALLWQAVQLLFLITGWSEAVTLRQTREKLHAAVEKLTLPFQFRRVMA